MQTKNLEDEIRSTKTGLFEKTRNAFRNARRYASIALAAVSLAAAPIITSGCDDYGESECCEKLDCNHQCIDTTNYNDQYCVTNELGHYDGCCHCEQPNYEGHNY